jgi:cold shock protein
MRLRGTGGWLVAIAVIVFAPPYAASTLNFSCDGWGDTNSFHLALDITNKKATRFYPRAKAESHDDVSTDPKFGPDKVFISAHTLHWQNTIVLDLKTLKYSAHDMMTSDTAFCRQEATSPASITWTEPPLDTSTTRTAATGTVRMFKQQLFGFIVPDGGGKEVLVHITEVEKSGLKTLQAGQQVSFDMVVDSGGAAYAKNLHLR